MPNIFLISDTHFGHSNILTFKQNDGTNLRIFDSVEHMDETMVANWNSVVRPQDKIYHMGDVCINNKHLPILNRLNGIKVLVKGNHDIAKLSQYALYFKDVRAYHVLDKMIMSHIPVHPHSQGRYRANIHGHLHSNNIMLGDKKDPFYFNVSVEQINYTPIPLETVKKHFSDL